MTNCGGWVAKTLFLDAMEMISLMVGQTKTTSLEETGMTSYAQNFAAPIWCLAVPAMISSLTAASYTVAREMTPSLPKAALLLLGVRF